MAIDQDNDPAFLVFRGGPFYNLQLKTNLLDGTHLKPLPRALIFSSWAMTINNEGRSLSLAAWWSIIISNTLFWFLLLRAVLRHIVWALLLRDFSRLRTRLVATHPDSHAGLSFVGRYPNGYILFTVAVSSVVAGTLTHQSCTGQLQQPHLDPLWVFGSPLYSPISAYR
ncbi:hypothetical protein FHS21_002388 [Phyllobacterium trifolii]|jgi:hypothetical protein|uniref:Uncharacterized protein n=1 Tax=Phyllobacterium trifolii TaxID=300193 RepID=A0A839U7L3_9HYPH|nr:hypothetical protein [Phyllobacterium trifolii]MBB3145974.1 hypothetical protein [Phyllobacterium trifolii]